MRFLDKIIFFVFVMLTRSLFKPIFTNYLSKTVTFAQGSTVVSGEQGSSSDSVSSAEKVSLKKLRIKSFFNLNPNVFIHKNVLATSLKPGSGPFGSFFSREGSLKLLSQLPGSEAPLVVFFNNISNIPVSLCGKRLAVYNGKLLMPVYAKRSLLGVSLRHLIRCKRTGRAIHAANSAVKVVKKR
ncbi:MAG: hypothetical protein F9K37_00945 [Bacteroidales bacterium]|nr:MAG: hypothetical protein F9K37_00945 [Bacteroidales bacterium]